MKTNKNKYLFLILLILLGIVFFPLVKSKIPFLQKAKFKDVFGLEDLNTQLVSEVKILHGEEEKNFKKEDNLWKINSDRADSAEVEKLTQAIRDIKVSRLVSKNKDNFANFGISEDDQYVLEVKKNGENIVLLLGNTGPSLNTFYIKKKDSDRLYLASGALHNLVTKPVDGYKEKDKEESENSEENSEN